MTTRILDRADRSTLVAELVGGAGRGGAVGRHHGNVHRAAAGRAGGGDLGIGDHRHRGAGAAELDICGTGETTAGDGNAVTTGPGAARRGDSGHLR